jgi:hypothetical protein
VTGVIVLVGADRFTVRRPPDDVQVITRRHLVRWLAGLPEVLDGAAIEELAVAGRRGRTWRPRA